MAWFKKSRKPREATPGKASKFPEGLWVKCPGCAQITLQQGPGHQPACLPEVRTSLPHRSPRAAARPLRWRAGSSTTLNLVSTDPLRFIDTKPYADRLKTTIASTGERDAVVVATGAIDGQPAIVAAMEYSFIGGSMGVVVGEKITRGIERALAERLPVIIVSCSGGARMMEGALSLMQMAKISAALARLDRAGLPYISILTDPTTGGVTASFAMLGDLNIAEPKALIGFAGPRVIEQTIRQKLPEGFQRSEFLLDHGMIDAVVDRRELKGTIGRAFRFMVAAPTRDAVPAPVTAR